MTFPVPSTDLEAEGPTLLTFFRGDPHWSNPSDADIATIRSTEARLSISLPELLRELYLKQNGGGSDFAYTAREPGASLTPGDDDFYDTWRCSLPDFALLPLDKLTTMNEFQDTFDYDPDYSWQEHLPGADRLIRIGQEAWDKYLCLDYSSNVSTPSIVFFDDTSWEPGK